MPMQAAHATIHMSEAAMVRARNWEASWLTGVYVDKGHQMLPLTFPERRELYLQQTLATPGAYLKRMFAAGIDQARGAPGEWGGGFGGYGKRYASREGQLITSNTLAGLGNAVLGYEPRYDQCQCSGFWPRTRHAIMRNFLTYNHSEQDLRPPGRTICRRFRWWHGLQHVETTTPECVCRRRPGDAGPGGLWNAAQLLY